jgi:hypothetical protein
LTSPEDWHEMARPSTLLLKMPKVMESKETKTRTRRFRVCGGGGSCDELRQHVARGMHLCMVLRMNWEIMPMLRMMHELSVPHLAPA